MRQCKHSLWKQPRPHGVGFVPCVLLRVITFVPPVLAPMMANAADVRINGADISATAPATQETPPPKDDAAVAAPGESQSYRAQGSTRSGELEQIVVTGTRLNLKQSEVPQEVQVYTRRQIDQSGQTTVADFMNTLPGVSLTVDPGSLQTANAATGVRLHGLPLGATLVLLDGRRMNVSASAAFNDIFDLNNVPLAAVERIEVLPQGSSAIYGSDAIAGVVNIILKKEVDGFDGSVKYGAADDTHEADASLAWGGHWDHGAFSVVGSYLTQSELLGADRPLTADANFTSFGSTDHRFDVGNPGNVFSINGSNLPGVSAPYAAVPPGFTGPPTQAEFAATAGQLNKSSLYSDVGLIPEAHRAGLLANANYDLSPAVELTGQLLYSHVEQYQHVGPAGFLYGSPSFQSYTVAAANPYNPFDETVGIGYTFPGVTINTYKTDFLLSSIGAQGNFTDRWSWEVTAWDSFDSSKITISGQPRSAALQAALNSSIPSTALNPLVAGSPGSQQLVDSVLYTDVQKYRGNSATGSALLRGSLLRLPSGDITIGTGAEFTRETLHAEDDSGNGNPDGLSSPTVGRNNYAAYAEMRVPVIGPRGDRPKDVLAITAAERYDHYDGFGGKATAQLGGQWQPLTKLLLRASWSQAFKAPSLFDLNLQQTPIQGIIVDPATGRSTGVTIISGGNPALKPETGQSHEFGLVYGTRDVPGVEISITNWSIQEHNSIQALSAQIVVDNANDFPGSVIRAPSCTTGPPCPIVSVNRTFANFGDIDVAGVDYLIKYTWLAGGVKWIPSITATQTYHYTVAFQPGEPASNRVSQANDDENWAPRWKGTAALQLQENAWRAVVAGRFTGKYRDYDPLVNGTYLTLGNLWYCDANLRYRLDALSPGTWARNAVVEIGGVNILNRQPQFSNMFSGFYGFDTLQADMRGRFLYIRLAKQLR
jgi:iron complex outermembrane receptor protein